MSSLARSLVFPRGGKRATGCSCCCLLPPLTSLHAHTHTHTLARSLSLSLTHTMCSCCGQGRRRRRKRAIERDLLAVAWALWRGGGGGDCMMCGGIEREVAVVERSGLKKKKKRKPTTTTTTYLLHNRGPFTFSRRGLELCCAARRRRHLNKSCGIGDGREERRSRFVHPSRRSRRATPVLECRPNALGRTHMRALRDTSVVL